MWIGNWFVKFITYVLMPSISCHITPLTWINVMLNVKVILSSYNFLLRPPRAELRGHTSWLLQEPSRIRRRSGALSVWVHLPRIPDQLMCFLYWPLWPFLSFINKLNKNKYQAYSSTACTFSQSCTHLIFSGTLIYWFSVGKWFNYVSVCRTCQPNLLPKLCLCYFGTLKLTATNVIW